MQIYLNQIRRDIVRPVLIDIGKHSKAAEILVMATGMAESGFQYIDQVERGGDKRPGPAYGPFQMERATHDDIWKNFIDYKSDLAMRMRMQMILNKDAAAQMHGNWYYAAAMCRIHYFRIPRALPAADDIEGLAHYWKEFYNTKYGAGTIDGFIQKAMPVWRLYGLV